METDQCKRTRQYGWAFLHLVILSLLSRRGSCQVRYSIQEELPLGTVVGNVAKDIGLDTSVLVDRNLRIVTGTKQDLFQVNQRDGSLFVNQRIDREELCGKTIPCTVLIQVNAKTSEVFDLDAKTGKIVVKGLIDFEAKQVYEINIQVSDKGSLPMTSYCNVFVKVDDVNDNKPEIEIASLSNQIPENTPVGTVVALIGVTDLDSGVNGHVICTLGEDIPFELKHSKDNKIPLILLSKPLDRELMSSYNIQLIAMDGGSPSRSGCLNVTVIVLDANDNAPLCGQQKYTVSVPENIPIGTVLIQVNASDADEGMNGEVEYSFRSNFRTKASEVFDLDVKSGIIVVKGLIDFEAKQVYEINIQVSDKGTLPMTSYCKVFVKVEDMNDNTPEIHITSQSNQIPENAPVGTVVAAFPQCKRRSFGD
uniref:Cadherin domain-containing protein n=1 Tax=Paramormyrops kingsleyae TaxID=1676925 RepID=A0A3B3RH40_9TELE